VIENSRNRPGLGSFLLQRTEFASSVEREHRIMSFEETFNTDLRFLCEKTRGGYFRWSSCRMDCGFTKNALIALRLSMGESYFHLPGSTQSGSCIKKEPKFIVYEPQYRFHNFQTRLVGRSISSLPTSPSVYLVVRIIE